MPEAHTSIAPGLHLFTSNRLETLAGQLSRQLRQPVGSALAPEILVVRNKGMERWLRQELARELGVCANCQFPFPEAFGREIFRKIVPDLAPIAAAAFDREALAWRIMREFPSLLDRTEFVPLRQYLAGIPDDRKLVQLASRIAHLFDQYLIFRPQLVLDWESGQDDPGTDWQPILWRAVSPALRTGHVVHLRQRVAEVLAANSLPVGVLPGRLTVFGVSALPPFYLELFAGLANRMQVNLFLLQPCMEYWGDITSPREDERILRRQRATNLDAFQLHLEQGNRLLASMGYLGRDFLKLLLDAGEWSPHEDFTEPDTSTLLGAIQSDILHLRDRGRESEYPPQPLPAGDDSILVHSCHSPLREMEVLHDQLLGWFATNSGLTPREVVVMTPEIETYAPFIHAVFSAPEDPSRRIPYSVADRGARGQSPVIDAFLSILSLPETRLGAATVLELLERPPVRLHAGLTPADLVLIQEWVKETHIRWGADAAHRESLGLPALHGNSWRDGLQRLLLGYSMAGGGERLFHGILPFDDVEGDSASVLGRFAELVNDLFDTTRRLSESRTLSAWADFCEELLGRFLQADEDSASDLQTLRNALRKLRQQQAAAEFDTPVSLAVLLERLQPGLEEDLHPAGFLAGGVTFCGLKPMRSIPFKVICLVGMNDSAFPRPVQHLSFDLMARQPRLGDRSTREDDRYLFLETLLSARQRLHISYVGQSVRDNSTAPPSVLVSELLDYIEQGFFIERPDGSRAPAAETRQRLIVQHRLQAFHADYFTPGHRLFSYSQENCRASTVSRLGRQQPDAFLAKSLGAPPAEFRQATLRDLARFLANPAAFFLKQRLNIDLAPGAEAPEERETFRLDSLQSYQIREQLIGLRHRASETTGSAAVHAARRAGGELPSGAIGTVDFQQTNARAARFLERLSTEELPALPESASVTDAVQLTLGDFQLSGPLPPTGRRGRLQHRCGKIRAKDALHAWVHHLAANCAEPGQNTILLGEDGARLYRPPDDPQALLSALLACYWRGLSEPLKFFPNTSAARAEAAASGDNGSPRELRAAWEGDSFRNLPGERDEPFVQLCFQNVDPLDEDFAALALEIFGPLLAHEQREPLEAGA